MKKSTTFQKLIQSVLTKHEIESLARSLNYEDTARKFTAHTLLLYWVQSSFEQWKGYREGADRAPSCGLPQVDYSTFSKKAKEVPFELIKRCFHHLIQKCNRPMKRKLQFPKELLLVDSTTITVGKTRLPWAPYHGDRAGIKLHVAFSSEYGLPQQVIESIGTKHDGPVGEELANSDFILVEDRAYGKIERLDRYLSQKQSYVIRLKDNVELANAKSLQRQTIVDSPVVKDITCQLGTPQCRSKKRHRVVTFQDGHGHEIRVVTDLKTISAEQIALIYKQRWQIELFFRWIKQHLNIPTLFGTTENAVYGQLYSALIAYVILKAFYDAGNSIVPFHEKMSFIQFSRLLLIQHLSGVWLIKLSFLMERNTVFMDIEVTVSG